MGTICGGKQDDNAYNNTDNPNAETKPLVDDAKSHHLADGNAGAYVLKEALKDDEIRFTHCQSKLGKLNSKGLEIISTEVITPSWLLVTSSIMVVKGDQKTVKFKICQTTRDDDDKPGIIIGIHNNQKFGEVKSFYEMVVKDESYNIEETSLCTSYYYRAKDGKICYRYDGNENILNENYMNDFKYDTNDEITMEIIRFRDQHFIKFQKNNDKYIEYIIDESHNDKNWFIFINVLCNKMNECKIEVTSPSSIDKNVGMYEVVTPTTNADNVNDAAEDAPLLNNNADTGDYGVIQPKPINDNENITQNGNENTNDKTVEPVPIESKNNDNNEVKESQVNVEVNTQPVTLETNEEAITDTKPIDIKPTDDEVGDEIVGNTGNVDENVETVEVVKTDIQEQTANDIPVKTDENVQEQPNTNEVEEPKPVNDETTQVKAETTNDGDNNENKNDIEVVTTEVNENTGNDVETTKKDDTTNVDNDDTTNETAMTDVDSKGLKPVEIKPVVTKVNETNEDTDTKDDTNNNDTNVENKDDNQDKPEPTNNDDPTPKTDETQANDDNNETTEVETKTNEIEPTNDAPKTDEPVQEQPVPIEAEPTNDVANEAPKTDEPTQEEPVPVKSEPEPEPEPTNEVNPTDSPNNNDEAKSDAKVDEVTNNDEQKDDTQETEPKNDNTTNNEATTNDATKNNDDTTNNDDLKPVGVTVIQNDTENTNDN